MGTTVRVSFEEFLKLQENADDRVRYELDDGEVIVTPSPTPRHNLVSFRLRRALSDFVRKFSLGVVTSEVDFRLSPTVVRKPDVAFIGTSQMEKFDLDHTPIETSPTLAIEVISESNLAQDTTKKVRQYLHAGSLAVWLVYPALRLVEIHSREGKRDVTERGDLSEQQPFGKHTFKLSLDALFDENPEN